MSASGAIAVIGGGSWGTALALHLARSGAPVALWVRDASLAAQVRRERENRKYLAGHPLPAAVRISADPAETLDGAAAALVAVPSHRFREVALRFEDLLRGARAPLLLATKGIENETLLRPTEIVGAVLGEEAASRTAVLSGPSFAREVADGHPTAVVVAAADPEVATTFQTALSSGSLRAYTSGDVVGVELAGALKNVVAVAAGVVEGLGYGSNTLAALITRGLAEMTRLAESLGGRRETLAGLAGLGDLVLTCTGSLSRNRALGIALGRGGGVAAWEAATSMVAEGIRTTRAAHALAHRQSVEMPITEQVHAVLHEGKPAAEGVRDLLSRQLRREW